MAEFEYTQWRHGWPEVVVQRRTDEAVELLRRYYAVTAAGRPAYSGSQFEAMAALNSDPYSIGPADFTAASMLSVDIPAQAAIRLLGRDACDITALLQDIPVDVDIIDIDLDDLVAGGPASRLWQVLRRGNDGMGRTRTSKLIAAKRPRLIPIWDSFVEQATGLDTVDYWRQFQAVLAVRRPSDMDVVDADPQRCAEYACCGVESADPRRAAVDDSRSAALTGVRR